KSSIQLSREHGDKILFSYVNRKHIPLTKDELKHNLKSYLRCLQNNPKHIQKLFQMPLKSGI
ncbi:MAG: hypothetical protein AB8U88_07645, partial [Rickettsia conorii subsp. raoultii]